MAKNTKSDDQVERKWGIYGRNGAVVKVDNKFVAYIETEFSDRERNQDGDSPTQEMGDIVAKGDTLEGVVEDLIDLCYELFGFTDELQSKLAHVIKEKDEKLEKMRYSGTVVSNHESKNYEIHNNW